jgi:hypothetical protein
MEFYPVRQINPAWAYEFAENDPCYGLTLYLAYAEASSGNLPTDQTGKMSQTGRTCRTV